MKYCVTDGTDYIVRDSNNKYSLSNDIRKANTWEHIKKAENFLISFPKNVKRNAADFYVKVVEQDEDVIDKIELNFEIENFVDEIFEKTKLLKQRLSYLKSELSRLDKERVDIEHAAEFYNLSASQGYNLYKRLHNNAIERRKVKDEIYKITTIFGSQINSTGAENIKKSFKGLEGRSYTPRVLSELFD